MSLEQLRASGVQAFPCWVRQNSDKGRWDKGPAVPRGISWLLVAQNPERYSGLDWSSGVYGVPVPEGVVVIDMDSDKGATEEAVAKALGMAVTYLQAAKIQDTISGGSHYAFRCDWSVKQGDSIGLRGLDTRVGSKGFICSGKGYTWTGFGVSRFAYPDTLPIMPDSARILLEKHEAITTRILAVIPNEGEAETKKILSALLYIDPGCSRSEWLFIGMALRDHYKVDHDTGLSIFGRWSAGDWWEGGAPENYVLEDIQVQWQSLKSGKGRTIATLFDRAKKGGWPVSASIDTSAAFGGCLVDPFARLSRQPFSTNLLPQPIADFAKDQASLIGLDPAIIGMAALGAAAVCIDDRQQIQPKRYDPTWLESSRLWVAIIGGPSTKKSPGLTKAMGPVFSIDKQWRNESQEATVAYETVCEDLSKGESKPSPPVLKRLIYSDATVEKIADLMSRCEPRGSLLFMDELSGWLGSFDAYRNGSSKDRPAYLESYNGGSRSIDRISRGSTFVENWSLSILGGIQPDVIHNYDKASNHDGLLQRFILVQAQDATMGEDRRPNMLAKAAYEELLNHLSNLIPGKAVTLSEGAHKVREAFDEKLLKLTRSVDNKPLAAALGKWSGTFARLLLTYHCIELVQRQSPPSSTSVSAETAQAVANLMWSVLLPDAVQFYAAGDPTEDHCKQIADLILAKGWSRFTVKRDLNRQLRASRKWKQWELDRAIDRLEAFGWIVPEPGKMTERSRPVAYSVTPGVHLKFSEQAAIERIRHCRHSLATYSVMIYGGRKRYCVRGGLVRRFDSAPRASYKLSLYFRVAWRGLRNTSATWLSGSV